MFGHIGSLRRAGARAADWVSGRGGGISATAVLPALGLALVAGQGSAKEDSSAQWLDATKPVNARVAALLEAMTLAEKVGQMDQQLVDNVTDPNGARCNTGTFGMPNPACMHMFFVDQHVGSVLAGGTDNPVDT